MAAQIVSSSAAPSLFGHLIPLGTEQNQNDKLSLRTKAKTQLLSLPGSFGRAELLEPFVKKKCPNCRHIKKEVEDRQRNQEAAPSAAVIGLCHFCLSVQSLAKFIPRKEFLNFTYNGGSTEQHHRQLVVTVSARNSAKLVRVTSTRPNDNNEVREEKTEDGMLRMLVNDGDVVSICWYQTSDSSTSSKKLKPLIQFCVFKCVKTEDSILTNDDDVVVQKKHNIEKALILEGDLKAGSGYSNESHLNNNLLHNKDEVGLVNTRSEEGRSENYNENDSQQSSEEEEESAPLSLPSKFLASSSKSYSFDSQLLTASAIKASLHAATDAFACSRKRKTPPQTGDATNSSFTTSKTPKKSNVQATNHGGSDREANSDTAALSTLSYDQLLQMRDQSTTTSLRHNVLSLALALGSNASAYDYNFLKEIQDFRTPAKARQNHAGDEGYDKMNSDSKKTASAEGNTRQWMPRLLQGTEIILNKNSNDKE